MSHKYTHTHTKIITITKLAVNKDCTKTNI